jgi:hypothetical protein
MQNSTRKVLLLLLLMSGGTCFAQSTNSGDIRGVVTDSSGAVIPGAQVLVINVETGVSKEYVSNQDGLYDTSSIVAGTYQLTFSKEALPAI